MATLNASIWLLIKEHADPDQIHKKFISVYGADEQVDFLWLYLYYATQADHGPLVSSILDHSADDIQHDIWHALTKERLATCVNEAIRKDNHRMMRAFLDRDPELCGTVADFYTAESRFRLAYSPIGLAIHHDEADSLALLLEYYSGETIGDDRQTPLHLVTRYPAPRCLRLLLADGRTAAHVNSKDAGGWTPLLCAAMYHPDAIPELLARGADASARLDKLGNALQILSNWCTRLRVASWGEHDPCPTLARRRTAPGAADDAVYVPDDFVSLAKAAVECGVDANADGTPLANFAANVHRRFDELRDGVGVRQTFVDSMAYLADVSNQAARDEALVRLCRAVNYVATQLRRCHDRDNMLGYVDMLLFIQRLMAELIARGANGDASEVAQSGEKKVRAFQFLLPYGHPRCAALKKLASTEFGDQSVRHNSTMDVLLVAILAMYSLGATAPDLYARAVGAAVDMTTLLVESGAKCRQTLHFFTCLCIDPDVAVPVLHRYLNCHNQAHYHDTLSAMQRYLCTLSPEEFVPFDAIRKEVATCQNRVYTLKQLVRRELVACLGGWQQVDKVSALPLPPTLKTYLRC